MIARTIQKDIQKLAEIAVGSAVVAAQSVMVTLVVLIGSI